MSDSEQYNGWANRETWAFWLHVTNDQGWYEMVKEHVSFRLSDEAPLPEGGDYDLGHYVVDYVRETLDELMMVGTFNPNGYNPLQGMRDDIGSWWRIDYAEIGAHARELVDES